ncbi:MAG: hypothetical protein Q9214_000668 [Letrouitia sp. 1 TL-2023]
MSVKWFRKAKWAVYQGDRFRHFVEEIRDLVDGLHKILPDISASTTERLIREIHTATDINSVNEVHTVAIDYHNDLAEAASARSEALSSLMSTHRISRERSTIRSEESTTGRRARTDLIVWTSTLESSEDIIKQYSRGGVIFDAVKRDSRLKSYRIRWIE